MIGFSWTLAATGSIEVGVMIHTRLLPSQLSEMREVQAMAAIDDGQFEEVGLHLGRGREPTPRHYVEVVEQLLRKAIFEERGPSPYGLPSFD